MFIKIRKENKTNRFLLNIFTILLIGILIIPSIQGFFNLKNNEEYYEFTNDFEYWALLVAVGVYRDNPAMDRPTMLQEIQRFEQLLSISLNWDEDHFKIIKGNEATVEKIKEGFQWLDEQENENDICLIYLTSHGFPLWFDRFPFDETDRRDEALASYTGFFPFDPIDPNRWEPMTNPFGIITDDQINRFLNGLESQGIGVIVDSCHSGGFDDDWSFGFNIDKHSSFMFEFSAELKGNNRIVVTSVREEDISYGSYFSHNLINGLNKLADINNDKKVTLEEAFYYAEDIVEHYTNMNPQIFDNYPGDLVLIEY